MAERHRAWMGWVFVFGAGCAGDIRVERGAPADAGGGGETGRRSGGEPICVLAPIPVGETFECGSSGAATGGCGGVTSCSRSVCDEAGGLFTTECVGNRCSCKYDLGTVCSCIVEGIDDICGAAASCCPEPFPFL
ncbi:MAG: hypothetical protein AAGN82_26035 [Myxococcota bacterium]